MIIARYLLVLISITLFGLTCTSSREDQLVIAAAANTQFVIRELAHVFEEKTGIQSDLVISSSGKLTAQIKEGAPYHVFVSANMKYPEELYRSGLCAKEPKIYAYGQLVLWTNKPNAQLSIESLEAETVRHIAIANPKTAPYGEAAVELLKHYGIFEKIKDKLVYGESISQTNQFILSGTAELGFTAQSVVASPELVGKGSWINLDTAAYLPIKQGVIVINRRNKKIEAAQQFYDFMDTPTARRILQKYGYQIREASI